MSEKALLERIEKLENQIRELRDIEDIKNLQKAYGYYIEHWMAPEIIDLFSDGPDVSLTLAAGTYLGKEGVRRYFESRDNNNPEFLHQVMQLCGVVDVTPDGKTAKGRWYGFGANAFPGPGGTINPGWMNGIYEVEYVKENDIWKLLKVRWCMTFHAPWAMSFVDTSKRVDERIDRPYERSAALRPTGTPEETLYPSGFICPFHYKNPVSGRETVK